MSKSIISLLAFITLLMFGSTAMAQFPLRYNFGGNSGTCGDFAGTNTYNILSTGNIPYEPGVNVISGLDVRLYDPNEAIIGADKNECMYQNELYGKLQSDLTIAVCDLPVGAQLQVTLHFSEIYFGITGAGQRTFDILVDGNLKQADFDTWAEANVLNGGNGGNNVAVDKAYTFTVGASGCVEVLLRADGIENAHISGMTLNQTGTTFPVEMLAFEARKAGEGQALLSWSTAQELNNAGFEVQYSKDGVNFSTGGFVAGAGTTAEVQSYQYTLTDLDAGRYTFRLKQIDFDGAYDYSRQVELAVAQGSSDRYSLSNLYPNPASVNTSLFISVEDRQLVNVQLFTLNGQQIGGGFQKILEGEQAEEVSIDTSNLTPGVYLVVVKGDAFRETYKLMVE